MPYLQMDVSHRYPIEVKRGLAQRLGTIYADVMQTVSNKVTVAFRELEEGSLWRCGVGEPTTAAVLMCDIRRGRPAEQRAVGRGACCCLRRSVAAAANSFADRIYSALRRRDIFALPWIGPRLDTTRGANARLGRRSRSKPNAFQFIVVANRRHVG
jgi:phenylpyruvate tautomerase PptA (4-oxalocrotonate tautomerase family)